MNREWMTSKEMQGRERGAEGFPPAAKMALFLIFRRFAGLSFKLEHLPKAAEGRTTAADLRAAVPALLRHRYLVSVRNSWGERLFYIPQEIADMIQGEWMQPKLEPISGSEIKLIREAKRGLALDLFRSLVWIAKYGIPVTAKGGIYQRALVKLSGQTALQPEDVTGLGLSYPHQETIPASAAVVLDLLLDMELIIQALKAWQLNMQAIAFWLEQNVDGMNAELYRRIQTKYVPAEAGLQHLVYAVSSPVFVPGEWYSIEMLIQWLQEERLLRLDPPEEWRRWLWGWMEAMCGFGWLELGCHNAGGRAFRWIDQPRRLGVSQDALQWGEDGETAESGFCVQPDFEIIVPPEVSFACRWELEAISECIYADRMSLYRLTRESIAEGIRLGRSWREALRQLKRSSSGVPDNVALALEEWGRELGEPGEPRVFPRLDGSLSKLPEQGGPNGIPLSGGNGSGWIFCGEDRSSYRLFDTGLEREELFPGLDQVPAIWLKTARSYHSSTAREMVSQAMKWHVMLALGIKGEMYEYLPAGLQGGADWQVTGKLFSPNSSEGRDAVLTPENWEIMRLLLPEVVAEDWNGAIAGNSSARKPNMLL
ncbi:helicase-associated domain-containing protein [Paenibacillus humicus]|uniref:helicase-associated domain-containing protein n=1 Tax=Paenibacillus humicus TaxID=412861 RepID=UPI003D2BD687